MSRYIENTGFGMFGPRTGVGRQDPRFTTLALNTLRRRALVQPRAGDVVSVVAPRAMSVPRTAYSYIAMPMNAGGAQSALSGYGSGVAIGALGTINCAPLDLVMDRLEVALTDAKAKGLTDTIVYRQAKSFVDKNNGFFAKQIYGSESCAQTASEGQSLLSALERAMNTSGSLPPLASPGTGESALFVTLKWVGIGAAALGIASVIAPVVWKLVK